MQSKKEKVVKTYGRHKSRVVKTDVWEDKIKKIRQPLFSGATDGTSDDDFVKDKKTHVPKKKNRKSTKGDPEKENRDYRTRKSFYREKLFVDKDTTGSSLTNSFSLTPQTRGKKLTRAVAQSTRKKNVQTRTKNEAAYNNITTATSPDLFNGVSEKNLTMHFSDFDNYELCISESPIPPNPHAAHFPRETRHTSKSSEHSGEDSSHLSSKGSRRPGELCNSDNSPSATHKTKKTRITTSTPALLPVVRLERSPETEERINNLKNAIAAATNRSSHNVSGGNGSFLNVGGSPEYDATCDSMFVTSVRSKKYTPTSSPWHSLRKNNKDDGDDDDDGSVDNNYHVTSAKCSPFDCVVQLQKFSPDVKQKLDMNSYISCEDYSPSLFGESCGRKTSRSDRVAEKRRLSRMLQGSCANCSLQQPCGSKCVYMKFIESCKPSIDFLSSLSDTYSVGGSFVEDTPQLSSLSPVGKRYKLRSKNIDESLFNASIEHINSVLETVLISSDEEDGEEDEEEEEGSASSSCSSNDVSPRFSGNLNDIDEEEEKADEISEKEEEEEDCDKSNDTEEEEDNDDDNDNSEESRYKLCSPVSLPDQARSKSHHHHHHHHHDISIDSGHFADLENSRSSFVSPGLLTRTPNLSRKSLLVVLSPIKCPLSPKSKILQQCQQDQFISFSDCIQSQVMKQCVKIGEGVYGEVFRTMKRGKSVALKVIPIEGNFNVNDCAQKNFAEILPEIVISQELSELQFGSVNQTRNFIAVNNVSCVQGKYPPHLLKQWDIFHKQKRSENDRPDIFTEDQLFVVFEFGDGGNTLEDFKFTNVRQAKNVLLQVVYSLAVAESALEFEHRDLHWGNVLVHQCADTALDFCINGANKSLPLMGFEVSIIDFTLSRLSKDGCTVFCDLALDEELFQGKGDYQFDVYRMMKTETDNQWINFRPRNNVFWIHYLADKLLNCKKYESNTRADREILRGLRQFVNEAIKYQSAVDLVFSCDFMQITDD
ncbi:uncharacterized protein LOC115219806 [Argonauta hians]